MTPLQKVAMGYVIVIVDATFGGYDAVPDMLGWVLACLGLAELRRRLPRFGTLLMLAAVAGLVSAVLFPPSVRDGLTESVLWYLSLPELGLVILLCGAVAELAAPADEPAARRLTWLRWTYILLVVATVVLYGGRVDALLVPIAVASVVANVALVYILFKISRRPFALP